MQVTGVVFDIITIRRISASSIALLFSIYVVSVSMSNPYSAAIPFIIPMIIGQIWAFFQVRNVR